MRSAESQTTARSITHSVLTLDTYNIANSYFFTIKHTRRWPTLHDYEKLIKQWEKHRDFHPQCTTYELDELGRLHVHGIALARPNFLLQRCNKKRYSVKIIPIESERDFKQVYKYCYKKSHNNNTYEQDIFLNEYEIRTSDYPFSNISKKARRSLASAELNSDDRSDGCNPGSKNKNT